MAIRLSSSEKPTTAFTLSLIAGLLFLINGVVLGAVASLVPFIVPPEELPIIIAFLTPLMILGIVWGIIVIIAAVILYRNPAQKTMWGVIILVLSIMSIFISGGFIIGLILGIIGGILALGWKPKTAEPTGP